MLKSGPDKREIEMKANVKPDLRPCPFCGGEAEILAVPGYYDQGKQSAWVVKCTAGCCNQMPHTSKQAALEAWNRRADG